MRRTQDISIRAPARGATYADGRFAPKGRDFNPRSREGSDARTVSITLSAGHFNPRSREGSDSAIHELDREQKISIRAPARGATTVNFIIPGMVIDFNPRSREGSDDSRCTCSV